MRRALRARVLVGTGILVAAFVLAIGTTWLYGALFQHERYWEGTIRRVEDTEIGIVRALLTRTGTPPLSETRDDLDAIFKGLDYKLGVELRREGRIAFTNRMEGWAVRGAPEKIELGEGAYLLIYRYEPPSWNSAFVRWVMEPRYWLTRKHDRITAPFVSFFMIYVVSLYALAWRQRARHLSRDVLAVLRPAVGGSH